MAARRIAMTLDHLQDIKLRLIKSTPGPWQVNSIGSKNYLMWFGGDWPEEHDKPNFDFIANAPKDIEYLLNEIELMYDENKRQQLTILDIKDKIKKLEEEIKEFKSKPS